MAREKVGNTRQETWLERISGWLEHLSTAVGVLVFCVMVVSIWLEVVFRYVLLNPLAWTDELAIYCMIWVGYLGIGVAMKHDEHPSLQFVMARLPQLLRHALRWLVNLGILAFLTAGTIWGFQHAIGSGMYRLTAGLGISMTLPMLAIPVGCLLAALQLCLRLIRTGGQ